MTGVTPDLEAGIAFAAAAPVPTLGGAAFVAVAALLIAIGRFSLRRKRPLRPA